jgi:hypothetical protein
MGRSTCASASALSLDAQPAQLERLVSRICLPEGCKSLFSIAVLYTRTIGNPGQIGDYLHRFLHIEGLKIYPAQKSFAPLFSFQSNHEGWEWLAPEGVESLRAGARFLFR